MLTPLKYFKRHQATVVPAGSPVFFQLGSVLRGLERMKPNVDASFVGLHARQYRNARLDVLFPRSVFLNNRDVGLGCYIADGTWRGFDETADIGVARF